MSILYLFTVYKSPEIVDRIINILNSPSSIFLIHIDKSSKQNFELLKKYPNVYFTEKSYHTPWGSPNLAFAVYDALKESQRWAWDYVCLMSESDYPVKTAKYIEDYLYKSNKNHILINPLPCDNPLETPGGHWLEGGRRRIECYAIRLNPKKIATIEPRKINIGNFRQAIKIIRFNPYKCFKALKIWLTFPTRKGTTDVLCGGHLWFFLKRRTTDEIIDYVDNNPSFIEDCKHTQCLDEIFFPTIVNAVNKHNDISRNILRYISWSGNGESSPVDISINEKDLLIHCISNPDILLVRKVSSLQVCDYIDKNLVSVQQGV